jgi:hypothetical protein
VAFFDTVEEWKEWRDGEAYCFELFRTKPKPSQSSDAVFGLLLQEAPEAGAMTFTRVGVVYTQTGSFDAVSDTSITII